MTTIESKFKRLEEKYQATLGIYAIDTKTTKEITYNQEERFAFTSTYKAIISGIILRNYTNEQLNKRIFYTAEDLVTYSPITQDHVSGGMTIREIIHAAITYSDNTAGNLLFNELNGPKEFQNALEKIGDQVTHSDRYETDLNSAVPSDIRDTTTPTAFLKDLSFLMDPSHMNHEALAYFKKTLIENTTGDHLIRAGVPDGYIVGDKTGAGSYGTRNDIAVIFSSKDDMKPFVWIIFSKMVKKEDQYHDQLIADAAKLLSEYYSL
ncbi:class A beta-lactamase [Listeria sp. PSOL-1]|uniref:class A beta-lactamase n=1 Tax=Listeria sp. PSOL-1 TaxID=1844999 RepID=UPI0013CF4490|nr:class A beta-lactamase [Listeria sp. PSOL-1]